jgi:tetrahydromethanopterin S-methyltransferase subunit E
MAESNTTVRHPVTTTLCELIASTAMLSVMLSVMVGATVCALLYCTFTTILTLGMMGFERPKDRRVA